VAPFWETSVPFLVMHDVTTAIACPLCFEPAIQPGIGTLPSISGKGVLQLVGCNVLEPLRHAARGIADARLAGQLLVVGRTERVPAHLQIGAWCDTGEHVVLVEQVRDARLGDVVAGW
jgi:hypothetical protein